MDLRLDGCRLRSWRSSDADAIARYANNRKIWVNMRDRLPHPYGPADARAYLRHVRGLRDETFFAIDVDGEAVGSIGYQLQDDIERVSAEVGYWVGEPFWGRGLATTALCAVTQLAIARHRLTRVFALPFAHNLASCRVLEKAGFVVEGRLRQSAIKNGIVLDQVLYACYAPTRDLTPTTNDQRLTTSDQRPTTSD